MSRNNLGNAEKNQVRPVGLTEKYRMTFQMERRHKYGLTCLSTNMG